MAGTMLDLVRKNVERRYGRSTWATMVGGPDAPPAAPPGTREGGEDGGKPRPSAGDAPSDALACWLGRQAVARVSLDGSDLLGRHGGLRSFLSSLDGRTAGPSLHGEEELSLTVGVFEAVDADLFVAVDGDGACCALVEGLIAGAADHYGERARLELLKCRKRGDNRCVIRVGFEAADRDAGLYFLPLSAEEPAGKGVRVV